MKKQIILITVLALLAFIWIAPLSAQEEKKQDDGFSGSFMVGYRGVDIGGAEAKYKEDINLYEGPRLFNLSLEFHPDGALKTLFDRFSLNMANIGGDPFESMDVSVAKYGKYSLNYQRRKAAYFYADHLTGHDFNTYDFDRIMDSATFKARLCRYAEAWFDFSRWTRKGNSTTSFDFNHDEFEIDRPLDESSSEYAIGLNLSAPRYSLAVEERIRDYRNNYRLILPGASEGENNSDAGSLEYFLLDQPYDFRSYTHTGRIHARPADILLIQGVAQLSSQDLRVSYSEKQAGTSYMGTGYTYDYTGSGNFDRNIALIDLDVTCLLSPKFALVAGIRYNKIDQDGQMAVYGVEMPMELELKTLGVDAGVQFHVNEKYSITAGFRSEKRDFNSEDAEKETTKRTGLFGNIRAELFKNIKLTLDYQYGSMDDPFTPVGPSRYHRIRGTAAAKFKSWFINGSYMYKYAESDLGDGWISERSELSLRAGYQCALFQAGAGYSLLYSCYEGLRTLKFSAGRTVIWDILNQGRTNMVDLFAHVVIKGNYTVGFSGNYYFNDGSWEIKRLMLRPFVELKLDSGWVGQVAYRYVELNENIYHLNDYNGDIFEVSFGYQW